MKKVIETVIVLVMLVVMVITMHMNTSYECSNDMPCSAVEWWFE